MTIPVYRQFNQKYSQVRLHSVQDTLLSVLALFYDIS